MSPSAVYCPISLSKARKGHSLADLLTIKNEGLSYGRPPLKTVFIRFYSIPYTVQQCFRWSHGGVSEGGDRRRRARPLAEFVGGGPFAE